MKVHFLQHESFEAPGAYLQWAQARGYDVSFSKVFEDDKLPESADSFDLLVVMGGPQGPNTTKEECPHFDSLAEQHLIKQAIDANKAVVGVCLGAQLIGEALGAAHGHSPEREVGNFPITFTQAVKNDEKFANFPAQMVIGHWHNDMPGLTADAEVLAYSEGCPRQIIRYTPIVYGFQCHAELNRDVVTALIEAEGAENLEQQSQQYRFVQNPNDILSYDYSAMNQALYSFLDKLAEAY